jgi:hypothetical protein
MTIKSTGGIFGRNPTFNNVDVEGTLTVNGEPISDFGTMAQQDATSVNIDGGAIDGTAIGASSASTGKFTSLDISDGNISNVGVIAADRLQSDADSSTYVDFSGNVTTLINNNQTSIRCDGEGNVAVANAGTTVDWNNNWETLQIGKYGVLASSELGAGEAFATYTNMYNNGSNQFFMEDGYAFHEYRNVTDGTISYRRYDTGTGGTPLGSGSTYMTIDSSLNMDLTNGGNIKLASGNGIDFSATAGTGTSELFDDYEEGTWTPTYAPASGAFGSVTYDTGITGGKYTKVGNLVHIQGGIRTDAITVGTASGGIRLGGLPFTAIASGTGQDGWSTLTIGQVAAFAGDVPSTGSVVAGQSYIELQYRSAANGATIDLAVADLDTGADDNLMRFSATYIAG